MILVTGGSGFIGTALARRLAARGADFALADLHDRGLFPGRFRSLDLTDSASIGPALEGATALVHLAAVHRDDVRPPDLYTRVNVEGTRALAEAAAAQGIRRIVFASSVAVYPLGGGASEATPPAPFNAYGRSKLAAEAVLRDWAAADPARSLTIVRPTVVFGPGNRGNVHLLFDQIHRRRFVMVGRGAHVKSLAFVDNVAAFIDHALTLPPGTHLFNYADTPPLSVAELVTQARATLTGRRGTGPRLPLALGLGIGLAADAAARLTGRRLPVSLQRVRKFAADTSVDAAAAHALPGFRAPVPLPEALERTFAADFLQPDPAAPVFFTE